MARSGAVPTDSDLFFDTGAGVVSSVTEANDFEKSTPDQPVQARDKITGLPIWQVEVMDFDPEARDRTFKVKIAAEHQPVPPDAMAGMPLRPVVLEGLQITPWIKNGDRPTIAYSLRCTGISAPKANGAATAKVDGRSA